MAKRKKSKVQTISGVVEQISKKFINARGKKTPVYAILVDDGDEQEWYRTKFDKPDCEQGDTVEFEFEETQYGLEVIEGSLEILESADEEDDDEEEEERTSKKRSSKKKSTTKSSGSKKTGTSRDDYWERKETKDDDRSVELAYVAARNTAVAYVTKLLELGVIKVGAAQNKKQAIADDALNHYTTKFFQATNDVDVLRELRDAEVVFSVDEDDDEEDGDE